MLTINPSQILFVCSLLLGTSIAVSSSSWFSAWLGLELNLMSFIPLISSKYNTYSSEAALKYFLIQALGSAIILSSAPSQALLLIKPELMILCALLLKMGAAPVHFWFPPVMQGISWIQCSILMTIQKVAPMLLLSYLTSSMINITFITASSMISSLIGALGGLNQTLIRKLMAYSSINHMAWMLAAINLNIKIWFNYFLIYSIVSVSVVFVMHNQQLFHLNQTSGLTHKSTLTNLATLMSMLSLGGLPPFLGFLPKMLVVLSMTTSSLIIWLAVLLSSALITLFYYLRLTLNTLALSSPKLKPLITTANSGFLMIIFINFSPLLSPLVWLLGT
uniref:NADH dehydrogenase subunit 2 n=1 Tax=Amphionides reynaudii TaxID=1727191 RepID=UPI0021D527E4|nr:NADH dehydrogenase subunit 2 [Amphionides reynaudii]UXG18823.1 NADH dehydrogenase subunit 2 [Amphionides reynaudii]